MKVPRCQRLNSARKINGISVVIVHRRTCGEPYHACNQGRYACVRDIDGILLSHRAKNPLSAECIDRGPVLCDSLHNVHITNLYHVDFWHREVANSHNCKDKREVRWNVTHIPIFHCSELYDSNIRGRATWNHENRGRLIHELWKLRSRQPVEVRVLRCRDVSIRIFCLPSAPTRVSRPPYYANPIPDYGVIELPPFH